MITTVHESQKSVLEAIIALHNYDKPIQADFTYSLGKMWIGLEKPEIRCDIDNTLPDLTHVADIRAIPFESSSITSAVIDLPFIHAHGMDSIMGNRFSSVRSQYDLDILHRAAAREAGRVITKNGILVWKCQDIVESGKQVWNHVKIMAHCTMFTPVDLLILVKKSAIQGHNHLNQQHARRTHCYFWVFKHD